MRWLYRAQKAGHTDVDPLATGLLPICLGEATKFSHYLLTQQSVIKPLFDWDRPQQQVMWKGDLQERPILCLTKNLLNKL